MAAEIAAGGGRALAVEVDIADRQSIEVMTEWVVSELGGIDILVNNAAVYHRKPWTEITEADWDQVLDTNSEGLLPLCPRRLSRAQGVWSWPGHQHRLDHLFRRGAVPARLCRLQGGIVGFTRALAREVGPDGITVNTLSPGPFPTDAEKIHPDLENYNREILAARASSDGEPRRTSAIW